MKLQSKLMLLYSNPILGNIRGSFTPHFGQNIFA